MIEIRRKEDIFYIDGGWFQGYWHFSFDRYHDPENMSFGTLRVFNIDTMEPGGVWPMHFQGYRGHYLLLGRRVPACR